MEFDLSKFAGTLLTVGGDLIGKAIDGQRVNIAPTYAVPREYASAPPASAGGSIISGISNAALVVVGLLLMVAVVVFGGKR